MQAFLAIGFVYDGAGNSLFLPDSAPPITFPDHVAKILDARDFYKKEIEKDRVARGLGRVAPAGVVMEDVRGGEEIKRASEAGVAWLAGGAGGEL